MHFHSALMCNDTKAVDQREVDDDGAGASVYSPVDAIFTAANYLCQNGAAKGADVAGAIFAYNHADW